MKSPMESGNDKSNSKIQQLMEEYLETLTEKERQAYEIAKSFLGMSFQLEKSNAFLSWKKNKSI